MIYTRMCCEFWIMCHVQDYVLCCVLECVVSSGLCVMFRIMCCVLFWIMCCEFWIMCHVQDYVLRCVLYYVFWIMCSGLCVLDCVLCYGLCVVFRIMCNVLDYAS